MTTNPWLTVKEAAAVLADVSGSTVYKLFARGEIAGAKVAGRVKLRRDSVEAYLAAHSNAKAPATEAEALQAKAQELNERQRPAARRRRRATAQAGFQH